MSIINDYYRKKQQLEQLSKELESMENNETLQTDFEFVKKLDSLREEFGKSVEQTVQVLHSIDPGLKSLRRAPVSRRARSLSIYKNPHTGEEVRTRGGNHKTLNSWKDKYGEDEVKGWKQN